MNENRLPTKEQFLNLIKDFEQDVRMKSFNHIESHFHQLLQWKYPSEVPAEIYNKLTEILNTNEKFEIYHLVNLFQKLALEVAEEFGFEIEDFFSDGLI